MNSTRILVLVVTTGLFLGFSGAEGWAQARVSPDPSASLQMVRDAKDAIAPLFFVMKNASGIGITRCDLETGVPFYRLTDERSSERQVHCVTARFTSRASLAAAKKLFGGESFLLESGIWVALELSGIVRPQPAIGIHN